MSNTITWMWRRSDGSISIRALFATTAIEWNADEPNLTFQKGFPLDRRDDAIHLLVRESKWMERQGAALVIEPTSFDLQPDAIREVTLGVTQGYRPTSVLIAQLQDALVPRGPSGAVAAGGGLVWEEPVIYLDPTSDDTRTTYQWDGAGWVPLTA